MLVALALLFVAFLAVGLWTGFWLGVLAARVLDRAARDIEIQRAIETWQGWARVACGARRQGENESEGMRHE